MKIYQPYKMTRKSMSQTEKIASKNQTNSSKFNLNEMMNKTIKMFEAIENMR